MEFEDHTIFIRELKSEGDRVPRKFVLVQTPIGHFGYFSDGGDFVRRRYIKVPGSEISSQYALFETGGFIRYTAKEDVAKQAVLDLVRTPVSYPHIPSLELGDKISFIEKRFKHRLWARTR